MYKANFDLSALVPQLLNYHKLHFRKKEISYLTTRREPHSFAQLSIKLTVREAKIINFKIINSV